MSTQLRPQIPGISLAAALAGVPTVEAPQDVADIQVNGVSVDSTDIDAGWIFVAIPGEKYHGVRFAADAIDNGAAVVLTDATGAPTAKSLGVPTVVVDNPRAQAPLIARNLYGPSFIPQMPLVGVTGTNGKTTTTYLIRSALEPKFSPVGLMGTVEIAVSPQPFSVGRTTAEAPVVYRALAAAAQNGYHAAVIEASSHAVSFDRIAGLYFTSVVFTNLQHDHLDFYGSWENYFEAKAALFSPQMARQGVVCVDDEWGRRLAREAKIPVATVSALEATPPDIPLTNHWTVSDIQQETERWGISFTLTASGGDEHRVYCPIPGLFNVQNAACAVISAAQTGVPLPQAIEGLARCPGVPGRMEAVPTQAQSAPRVIVDYAHTPEAMELLLRSVAGAVAGKTILVFGTDGDRDATKREGLAEIAARGADILWVTDENPRFEDPQQIRDQLLRGIKRIRPTLDDTIEVKTSRTDAVRRAIQSAQPGDLVLITGKGAEPYQEIQGVKHSFTDRRVAAETLAAMK